MAAPPPFYLQIPAVEKRNETTRFHIQPDSVAKPKPAPSNRGRKPSKGPPPRKKEVKRGMGVAQLEQIINNRNIAEINQKHNPYNHHAQVGGPSVVFGGGFENKNPRLGPFCWNPYVFGAPDMRLRLGSNNISAFETSNELSSMPKLIQHYDHPSCDSCCKKKKKFVNEEDQYIGYYNGREEKLSEMTPTISGSDFFANNNNIIAEGAEVVAIHRKIDPKGPNVFMEYEFFPDKIRKGDTFFKEIAGFQNPAESSSDGGGGCSSSSKTPSCLTTCDYGAATTGPSNSVDLSLKLSF